MLSNMHRCTNSIALKETMVKLHTRWYYTLTKLHRFSVPETYFRGCPDRDTHLHIFWSCKVIKPLWQQVSTRVAQITDMQLTLTFQMCLFFEDLPEVSPPCQRFAHTLFIDIHWAIALHWCSPTVPWDQVLRCMEAIQLMQCIHHSIMDTLPVFNRKWESWSSYGFVGL